MSPRVKPFMWKWVWFAWKWTCRGNTFLYIMVSHEDLFWHRGKKQLTYCSTQKNYSNPINELYMGASRGAAWSLWQSLLQFIFVTNVVVYWLCGILWCTRWWRKGMKIPHLTQTRLNVSYMDLYIVLKTAAMQTKQWSLLTSVYHLDKELYTPTCNIDFLITVITLHNSHLRDRDRRPL